MSNLPQSIVEFIHASAENAGVEYPDRSTDLFKAGVLDSFALVDFVSLVEEQCGFRVPDKDVNPGIFRTLANIESYIAERTGK
jgi:acyl carrier protein